MTIVSIDAVVRSLCGQAHENRFSELSQQILKELDADQTDALLSAHMLDGAQGAAALLAVWLKGNRLWVRIRPNVPRKKHVFEGATFAAGKWYSVPARLGELLRDEPLNDLPSKFIAVFQVESQPPALADGESAEWVW